MSEWVCVCMHVYWIYLNSTAEATNEWLPRRGVKRVCVYLSFSLSHKLERERVVDDAWVSVCVCVYTGFTWTAQPKQPMNDCRVEESSVRQSFSLSHKLERERAVDTRVSVCVCVSYHCMCLVSLHSTLRARGFELDNVAQCGKVEVYYKLFVFG